MTVVKDNGTVYIADGASAEFVCGYMNDTAELVPENMTVWKIPNDDGIIACADGSGFEADVFRYDGELITGELTMEKLVLETVPKMRRVLESFGKIDESGRAAVHFAFAQKDRAFVVSPDFCVSEIVDHEIRCRFENRGRGALLASGDMGPEERILFSRDMVGRNSALPMAVIDTRTLTPRVIGLREP